MVCRTSAMPVLDRRPPLLHLVDVLRAPVVGLESREAQARACAATCRASATAGSPGATPQRRLPTSISTRTARRTPAARAAASRSSTFRESSTHTATSACRASPIEPLDLAPADDLVRDEDVPHAPGDHGLRLAHLLAAGPDGAPGDLVKRDDRALVGLRVAAEAHGRARERGRPSGPGCARRRRGRRRAPGVSMSATGIPTSAGGRVVTAPGRLQSSRVTGAGAPRRRGAAWTASTPRAAPTRGR